MRGDPGSGGRDDPRHASLSPATAELTRATVADVLRGEVVLAPLTRAGNLPYRRLCVEQGARVTVSEMAHARHLAKRTRREMVLLRRHASESHFGVQLTARRPDVAVAGARVAVESGARFVDLNCGCPIDAVVRAGEGAALLAKPRRLEAILRALRDALEVPLFVKIRAGYSDGKENALEIARLAEDCGADALTVHGRTRQQRYRRPADWDLIAEVAAGLSIPVIGNGDILHARDALHRLATSGCAAVMVARGALVHPWIWRDLADGEDRARSSEERLAVYRRWVELALQHWGDDERGFVRVRSFLELHVDFWRRHVPPDAETDGEPGMQERVSFTPRDELEAVLQAPSVEAMHRACDVILEAFDPPPAALQPSPLRRSSSGGWG